MCHPVHFKWTYVSGKRNATLALRYIMRDTRAVSEHASMKHWTKYACDEL